MTAMKNLLQGWVSIGLLFVLLLCLAPLGVVAALVQSRAFWWACAGMACGVAASLLLFHH